MNNKKESMKIVNKVYKEFWKPLLGFFGLLNFNQVKRELYDFNFILEEVRKVYMTVTNNMISKPNTYGYEVIAEFENYIDKYFVSKCDIENILDNKYKTVKEYREVLSDIIK
jgi:hypothetical protein